MNIGFIGVGQMGSRMAARLLSAGYGLSVYDVRKEAAHPLLQKGARWMDTPKGVAESCQIVMTSLPGPAQVEEVVYGEKGLIAGWKKDDIYIDLSTNSPTTIRRVEQSARAKGVTVLDAPVSGGIKGAEAGTLSIMVGGDKECLNKVQKVLEAIGNRIFHTGDVGCGNICKLANNMLAIGVQTLNAECFVMGVKAGIDPQKLWDIITASTGNNPMLQIYPPLLFKGNFDAATVGFTLNLASKDISLGHDLAKEYGLDLPLFDALDKEYSEAKAAGFGGQGAHAVLAMLEGKAGIKVRSHVMNINQLPKMPVDLPIFTGGSVAVQSLITGQEMGKELQIAVINFSKGARTKLHTHTADQVLLVTAGRGMIDKGHGEVTVGVGDVIFIPAGEKHWHGATKDSDFSQISITRAGSTEQIIE